MCGNDFVQDVHCYSVGELSQLFHVLEDKFVYGIFREPREYSERGNFSSV